jgi:RimJ/RimL family protein N-acetyltransferase
MRFPSEILTPRTRLRAWQPGDAPALKVALDENKHHLLPWIPWATGLDTPLEEIEQRVAGFVADFEAGRNWIYGIFDRDGGQVLGGTGLHNRIGEGGLEIGYWIDHRHLNRGLAGEVAAALTEQAFSVPSIDRVEMHIDARNLASARIPARLGFRLAELVQRPERPGSEVEVSIMIWRQTRADRR